jgi:hypothetical protein
MRGLKISEGVMAVLGAIATFLGAFILFAGDDQFVGLGGDASWRVGDLSVAWGYGLAAAGVAILVLAAGLYRRDRAGGVPVERSSRADLAVHGVVFVLVNAFLWIQDIAIGGGVDYAWWITIPWGIGLAVHAVTILRDGGGRGAAVH